MDRLILLNFDAEYELELGDAYRPNQAMRVRMLALRDHLEIRGLNPANNVNYSPQERRIPHDARVWMPHDQTPPKVFPDTQFRLWCASAQAQTHAKNLGDTNEYPQPEVVAKVNSRAFCFTLRANDFYDHDALCVNASEVHRRLQGDQPFLLKRNFGVAGRGQRKVQGVPTENDRAWIEKSVLLGPLLLEPFVQIVDEFSIHGWVAQDARVMLGKMSCFATKHGAYSETRMIETSDVTFIERQRLGEHAHAVGHALAQEKYFGPFGVDAYRFVDARGRKRLRTLSEINARFCFGWDDVLDGWDPP